MGNNYSFAGHLQAFKSTKELEWEAVNFPNLVLEYGS